MAFQPFGPPTCSLAKRQLSCDTPDDTSSDLRIPAVRLIRSAALDALMPAALHDPNRSTHFMVACISLAIEEK